MLDPVIYETKDQCLFIVDIPVSIANAQDASLQIASCSALEQPWNTPEPKGRKRDKLARALPQIERDFHYSVQRLVENNLVDYLEARPLKSLRWHYPRWTDADYEHHLHEMSVSPDALCEVPVILSTEDNEFSTHVQLQNRIVTNPNSQTVKACTCNGGNFVVPRHSCFIWANIQQHFMCQEFNDVFGQKRAFDFIIMDPPWANRSVRHARTYAMLDQQVSDPFEHALGVVRVSLKPRGHVAIWITNKQSIRERVLNSMRNLGLSLLETWAWVKITTTGEPITPLDGFWRKPYEILLIFGRNTTEHNKKKRCIFAVPDIHSRKPNIESLIERVFQPESVLELFARNLTAGWWSWGNEVLKFQHSSLWRQIPQV